MFLSIWEVMMPGSIIELCFLSKADMHIPIEWAKAEGWNPGLDDHNSFFAADQNGFMGLRLEGEIIATISAVEYQKRFAFIGFFIVAPAYRGQGFGRMIWNQALDKLKGLPVGLDGVPAQQGFYAKSGFELAHRNIRYRGLSKKYSEESLNQLKDVDFSHLADYDASHFGFPRIDFLRSWVSQKNATTRLALCDNKILGIGIIRKCYTGYKIGPLFAENIDTARDILHALQSVIPESSEYFIDLPSPNISAIELCKEHSLIPVFETARMYNGIHPRLSLDNIYGITSYELG
jgi:GNAT superfamily N-acetyltransferase